METSQDQYGTYLRLLLFIATVAASIAQISSSMALLNEIGCHVPSPEKSSGTSNLSSAPQCAACASYQCGK